MRNREGGFSSALVATRKIDMSLIQRIASRFVADLAIDLGTSNTVIFSRDQGIVVDEPSIAAVDQRTGHFVAFGREAKAMLGRTPDGIITISPIKDGVIANFKVAECLLRHLIEKAIGSSRYRRCRMILSVPSVITPVEKRAVVDSALRACSAEVYLVDQAMAAAIGADLRVIEPRGSMVVDIGGGTTDIAVISLSGLVCSQTVRIAGNAMDAAIKDYVRKNFNLIIGENTAEQFKIHMGADALWSQATFVAINGRARIEGLPATANISGSDLIAAIEEPVNTIVAGVRATLERVPPELSGDIADRGITLTGGGALTPDIGRRIEKETKIRTHLAEAPLKSVVVGGGALLRQKRLLERVTLNW